jgi:hypothetical protein
MRAGFVIRYCDKLGHAAVTGFGVLAGKTIIILRQTRAKTCDIRLDKNTYTYALV